MSAPEKITLIHARAGEVSVDRGTWRAFKIWKRTRIPGRSIPPHLRDFLKDCKEPKK